MFNSILKINKQILQTEREAAKVRLKLIAKQAQLDKIRNRHAGKGVGQTQAQATAQFEREQRTILGPQNAAAAGDVDALGAGLLQAQDDVIAANNKIANAQNVSAEEAIKMADELSEASDRAKRFKDALDHASDSTLELKATQEALAIANKKRDFLQNAAFMNQKDLQKLSDDSIAGTQLVANPKKAAQQFDKFGDSSAEFFQGGLSHLKSLQDMGITTMRVKDPNAKEGFRDVNIQDSLDEFTIERLGKQSGLQGEELKEFKAGLRKTLDERKKLQEKEAQLQFRQVEAMEKLTLAMEKRSLIEQAEKKKARDLKIKEDKVKEQEDQIKEDEKVTEQRRKEKKEVDDEITDRKTLGEGVAGDERKVSAVSGGEADLTNIKVAREGKEKFDRERTSDWVIPGAEAGTVGGEAVRDAGKTGGTMSPGVGAPDFLNAAGEKAAIAKANEIFVNNFQPSDDKGYEIFQDAFAKGIKKASVHKVQQVFDNAVQAYFQHEHAIQKDKDNKALQSRGKLRQQGLTDPEIDRASQDPDISVGAAKRQQGRDKGRRDRGEEMPTTGELKTSSGNQGWNIGQREQITASDREQLDEDRASLQEDRRKPVEPEEGDPSFNDQAALNTQQAQWVCPADHPFHKGKGKCFDRNQEAVMSADEWDFSSAAATIMKLDEIIDAGIDQKTRTLKYDDGQPSSISDLFSKGIPYYNAGGPFGAGSGFPAGRLSKGTDTRLAALTPGEFVVNRMSSAKNLGLLHAINNGNTVNASRGGRIGYFQDGGNGGSGGFGAFASAVQLFAQAVSSISMSGQGGPTATADFGTLATALTNFPTSTGVQGLIGALNRFTDTFGSQSIQVKMESNGVEVNLNGVDAFADLAEGSIMEKVGEAIQSRFKDLFQGQDA